MLCCQLVVTFPQPCATSCNSQWRSLKARRDSLLSIVPPAVLGHVGSRSVRPNVEIGHGSTSADVYSVNIDVPPLRERPSILRGSPSTDDEDLASVKKETAAAVQRKALRQRHFVFAKVRQCRIRVQREADDSSRHVGGRFGQQ